MSFSLPVDTAITNVPWLGLNFKNFGWKELITVTGAAALAYIAFRFYRMNRDLELMGSFINNVTAPRLQQLPQQQQARQAVYDQPAARVQQFDPNMRRASVYGPPETPQAAQQQRGGPPPPPPSAPPTANAHGAVDPRIVYNETAPTGQNPQTYHPMDNESMTGPVASAGPKSGRAGSSLDSSLQFPSVEEALQQAQSRMGSRM